MLGRLALTLFLALAALPAQALKMGDDGLYKPDWISVTFKDLAEDLEAAREAGKRLVLIFEQRGCIYCKKMHEQVLSDPEISALITKHFMVIQLNLYGDEDVTDFDGKTLSEKAIARRWRIMFTPTIMFMPEKVPAGKTAAQAAVATMPGAFGKGTTMDLFRWVLDKRYLKGEPFQRYHGRKILERQNKD